MSKNIITIQPGPGNGRLDSTMFRAPDNEHAAHALFLFLAENMKPGFVVELAANGRSITQASGSAVASSVDGETLQDGQGQYNVWLNGRLVLTVSGFWDEIATAVIKHAQGTFPGRSFNDTADSVDAGYQIVAAGE